MGIFNKDNRIGYLNVSNDNARVITTLNLRNARNKEIVTVSGLLKRIPNFREIR